MAWRETRDEYFSLLGSLLGSYWLTGGIFKPPIMMSGMASFLRFSTSQVQRRMVLGSNWLTFTMAHVGRRMQRFSVNAPGHARLLVVT